MSVILLRKRMKLSKAEGLMGRMGREGGETVESLVS